MLLLQLLRVEDILDTLVGGKLCTLVLPFVENHLGAGSNHELGNCLAVGASLLLSKGEEVEPHLPDPGFVRLRVCTAIEDEETVRLQDRLRGPQHEGEVSLVDHIPPLDGEGRGNVIDPSADSEDDLSLPELSVSGIAKLAYSLRLPLEVRGGEVDELLVGHEPLLLDDPLVLLEDEGEGRPDSYNRTVDGAFCGPFLEPEHLEEFVRVGVETGDGETGPELVGHEELDERDEVVASPSDSPEDPLEVSSEGGIGLIYRGNVPNAEGYALGHVNTTRRRAPFLIFRKWRG